MTKAGLRKQYHQKRMQLSEYQLEKYSIDICKNLMEFFQPGPGQKLHIFLPIMHKNEINTKLIISSCFERSVRVFVPKVVGRQMISIEIFPESDFTKNSWGIEEPLSSHASDFFDFDLVVTPLLYADSHGNRVGYGKGFYDAFFASASTSSKKVGVNYFPPQETISDVREEDIPLDYLVLPDAVLSFGRGL